MSLKLDTRVIIVRLSDGGQVVYNRTDGYYIAPNGELSIQYGGKTVLITYREWEDIEIRVTHPEEEEG